MRRNSEWFERQRIKSEVRQQLTGEAAQFARLIAMEFQEMSKALDDLTAATTALTTAVTSLIAKADTPGAPDESAQLEAVATSLQGLVTQINAALAPKAP